MAIIIPALPYTLTNGTTADANQVMADLNDIVSGVNNNAAHNGPNSDITSLTGLTTPLTIAQGGTGVGAVGAAGTIPVSDGTAFAWSTTVNGPLTITGAANLNGGINGPLTITGTTSAAALTTSGAVNLNGTPNNIKGVTDGSLAAAGYVGEYLAASAAFTSISNNTTWNLATLNLTAGDWDLWGAVAFAPTAALSFAQGGISPSGSTLPGAGSFGLAAVSASSAIIATNTSLAITPLRVSLSAPAPYYLNAYATFASGTCQAGGNFAARRVR
jgi:hypothetical protein